MEREYGSKYAELYLRHWWWRAREFCILDSVRDSLSSIRSKQILDVGCGNGLFFDHLLKLGDVEGVEPDASLVDPHGRHARRIHIRPFESFAPAKQYSLILMLDVLEHLSDPVGALRHAGDLLTPDGFLLCTLPAFRFLWTSHDVLNHHFTRYSKKSFRLVSQLSGFELCYERYLFQWVFFAKLVVRLKEKILRGTPRVPKIPSAPINKWLFKLTCAEYHVFRWFPVPFGSSLFVIARKPVGRPR